ncbi:MAG: GNAT family N-acetyltransferase [Alphaproteobacteria bacterium]|nr:GNAT family N-acetyltransferase [Alphaproteobacteria bacterium]MBF0249369.1 GNAT family N-acetyltransferase [Alphaproteobacteria bacterium]
MNNLEIRLAESETELTALQALRYQVFYREMGARAEGRVKLAELDFDAYDDYCDHLVIVDRARSAPGKPFVAGCARLLPGEVAEECGGFYSESEYEMQPFLARAPQVLELGRTCVDSDYRGRGVMQLLWRGIAEYIRDHDVKYLVGCASIPGADPSQMRLPLSYLYHHHLAPNHLRTHALMERHVEMNTIPKEAIDVKEALRQLPPLLKGYLRLGAMVGDGAVIDYAFNTVDVNVVLETGMIADKYANHFVRSEAAVEFRDAAA